MDVYDFSVNDFSVPDVFKNLNIKVFNQGQMKQDI